MNKKKNRMVMNGYSDILKFLLNRNSSKNFQDIGIYDVFQENHTVQKPFNKPCEHLTDNVEFV